MYTCQVSYTFHVLVHEYISYMSVMYMYCRTCHTCHCQLSCTCTVHPKYMVIHVLFSGPRPDSLKGASYNAWAGQLGRASHWHRAWRTLHTRTQRVLYTTQGGDRGWWWVHTKERAQAPRKGNGVTRLASGVTTCVLHTAFTPRVRPTVLCAHAHSSCMLARLSVRPSCPTVPLHSRRPAPGLSGPLRELVLS